MPARAFELDDCENTFPSLPLLPVFIIFLHAACVEPFNGSPMHAQSPNKTDASNGWKVVVVFHKLICSPSPDPCRSPPPAVPAAPASA